MTGVVLHGWLVVDKPIGIGSTPVVGVVKRALRDGGYARVKVGHGGTLDPLASGVLPVALGEATKLAGRMLEADKGYEFTIRFGEETSTLDAESEVVARSEARPSRDQVEAVLARFTGEIAQVPPTYSALMVGGRRAYDRARAGEVVEMVSRTVTVHELKSSPARGGGRLPQAVVEGGWSGVQPSRSSVDTRNALHHPAGGPPPRSGEELEEITLAARVSKGTYIRSLARDIAHALGTVGHVARLRRTHAGPFTLARAITLDKMRELAMAGALEQALLPLTGALDDIPALPVTPDQASALRQGRTIGIVAPPSLAFATLDDVPVALIEIAEQDARVVRGFNL